MAKHSAHACRSVRKSRNLTSTKVIGKPRNRNRQSLADVRLRAIEIIEDRSVESPMRGAIRYALGIDDPWLPELVKRAEAGDRLEEIDFSKLRQQQRRPGH